ncbi:MAG: hypothetical protein SF029_11320, partial [bacterium]|nr:hypothetical protein [bacterium]
GTVFVGNVEADGGTVTLEQEFIVNGTVNSGVYALPITLRYQTEDGTTRQDDLRASVLVVKPPQLQIDLQSPVPEQINLGEPLPITLTITNGGNAAVNLTSASAEVEGAEVLEGAQTRLAPLAQDDDTSYTALVLPSQEGEISITVTLRYLDDLNIEREIVQTYETTVVAPPPIEEIPIDLTPLPTEPPEEENLLGRLLLGLLGLGS